MCQEPWLPLPADENAQIPSLCDPMSVAAVLACNLTHRSAQDDGSCLHMPEEVVTRHRSRVHRPRTDLAGHCGPEPGCREEASDWSSTQPLRSTEGQMAEPTGPTASSQLTPSLSKDRGTREGGLALLLVTQGPHRARVQAPCGRPP